MHLHGVDVLPDVILCALGEAVRAKALRQCAVIITTAKYWWVVVAPALAGGTAGAGKLGVAVGAGFVHFGWGFAVIMCADYNVYVNGFECDCRYSVS
mgnify:CR=1 FL=1